MSNYKANPKKLENFTQSGEDQVFVGKRNVTDFLPSVLQTDTNKRFLTTTLDQLLSSGSTESLDTYWGRVKGKDYRPGRDLFIPEYTPQRINNQLSPGVSLKNGTATDSAITYNSILNTLKKTGSDIDNLDKLTREVGYTLDMPIDNDMYINYINYYWLSKDISPCVIEATSTDPIDIDNIRRLSHYTTPVLANGKQLELLNGMRVVFSGQHITSSTGTYKVNATYWVEGVGTPSIKFVEHLDENSKTVFHHVQPYSTRMPSEWDTEAFDSHLWDYSDFESLNKEYIVANRSSVDQNAWARANQWYSIYALRNTCDYLGLDITDYANPQTRAQHPIICWNENLELYNAGQTMIRTVDHLVSDANAVTTVIGQASYTNTGRKLQNDDIVLFIDSGVYSSGIYRVGGVGTSITLTPLHLPNSYTTLDKVLVLHGPDLPGINTGYPGLELYWDGNAWKEGQQKLSRGDAPLWQLYSNDGRAIQDFEESTFNGDPIFRYAPNSAGVVVQELGFAPSYNSANSGDINFELTLNTQKYITDEGQSSARNIEGYYYAKDIVNGTYTNCWSKIRGGQRTPAFKTHIAKANETVVFKNVTTADSEYSKQYFVQHDSNGFVFTQNDGSDYETVGEHNPTLVWDPDTTYTLEYTIADTTKYPVFLDPYGATNSNITVTNTSQNTYTISIAAAYPYSTVYYMETSVSSTYNNTGYWTSGMAIGQPEFAGRIYLSSDNKNRIKVYKNGTLLDKTDYTLNSNNVTINSAASADDVYELYYIQNNVDHQNDLTTRDVSYDTSPLFKYNPLNDLLGVISFSNLLEHFNTSAESVEGFTGRSLGENNLHKTFNLMSYGGTIRQQISGPVRHAFLSSNSQTSPYNSLRKISDDYTSFKNYFQTKVRQLWIDSSSDVTVREIVNTALEQINIGKNSTFNYNRSDMVYYNNLKEQSFEITNTTVTFDIGRSINTINESINHLYVYLYEYNGTKYAWRTLQKDIDYTVDVDVITLTNTVSLNGNTPATLATYYKGTQSESFVPPSAVKLGFFRPTQVEIVNGVLHCHDGSTYTCTGTNFDDTSDSNFDIVTACMLDLEKRIVAGLTPLHKQSTEITDMLPNANFATSNTWADMQFILDDWYNIYANKNNIVGFNDAGYYDANDEFTWNYSSVGPGLGSWKALYMYYFGTTRPHTHPWEMLGHRIKPTWWDTYYDWTNTVRRANLIQALIVGETGDPGATTRTTSIKYKRNAYDWSNTLVTTAGVLNGPATAGVVSSPSSIERSKDFDFNDWGPYESAWRDSSGYTFALVECALIFKPFRTMERFFNLRNIQRIRGLNTKHLQLVNVNGQTRQDLKNVVLHNQSTVGKTLTRVAVTAGGTGYNNSTTAEVNDTKFGSSNFDVRVSGGSVQAVAITKTVQGYEDDVTLSVNGITGSNGAVLKGFVDDVNPIYMGFNNIVMEWGKVYNITTENLQEDFKNLEVELQLHIGGYTDKNILNVYLDSSYQKGQVELPKQDFSVVLNKSAPIKSCYYSGLKIEKSSRGYTLTGYNNLDRTFTIVPVNTAGKVYKDEIGNLDVSRYINHKNITEKYSYGHTVLKRQDLYNFMLGLAEYYEQQGFACKERWIQDARAAMEWSLADSPDPLYVNGIQNTLEFTQGSIGYVDYIGYSYDGIATIIDSSNKQIKPNELLVLRNDTTTEFSLKDLTKHIFGISVNVIEYEHVITLNNQSQFNDNVFYPVTGASHTRVKLEGERTRNWNGRIEAPGYLVKPDGLMTNLETSIREVERDNINSDSKTLNRATRETSRFNVGFIEGSYLSNTFIEDNAAYNFGKGQRKMKGTKSAIDAFMRNQNLFGTNPEHDIYEEWMIRLGDYGDITKRNPIEIELDADLLKTNPQAIRFNSNYVSDDSSDLIIDYHSGSQTLVTGDLSKPFETLPELRVNNTIKDSKRFEKFLPDAGLPLSSEAEHKIATVDDIGSVYSILEEYARISNWSSVVAYKRGDKVRKDGRVYQLSINSTGLTNVNDEIIVRGTQVYPNVPSGDTLIIDGTTITLSKTATTTTYNTVVVDGSINNPTAPNNSTLILDGTSITLSKTATTTTYNPIVVTGTVGNPLVVGNAGEGLLFDGIFVDLAQNVSTTTNISALTALVNAFQPSFVTSANENTVAVARINALEDLRVAYTAAFGGTAWLSWISNYFSGIHADSGINITWLSNELASAIPSTTTEITALLQNDIDIVNAVTNQSYTTGSLPSSGDINSTVTALDTGAYMDEFATFVKTGAGVLTSSVVDTLTTQSPRNWDIDDLVQTINSVLISNSNTTIVASKDSNNRLVITKTASAGDQSLTVGAGGSNAEIGFNLNSTVYNSTTNTVVTGATLTLLDIINEINNANISGVAAGDNNGVLRITSINQSLVIGNGTANGNVGINIGTTNATQNVTTSPVDLQIFDLVDQINNANITGVTASNVNNNLILTSTNASLTIGAGTANDDIGLMAMTTQSNQSVQNTFNLADWTKIKDPADFRIWTLDNIGQNTINTGRSSGYNLFQVFDFDIEIEECCAGNRVGDDALIKTTGNARVATGDFVVIINSSSTPSVDGIHQVIDVEDMSHFYIDKFIETKGSGGKLLLLKPTKFNDSVEMTNTLTNTSYYDAGMGWQPGMLAYVDNVIVNGVGTNKGAVYVVEQDNSTVKFTKLRDQAQRADNTKIKNALLYNSQTQQTIETFEVFHPLAGIIPGAVDKELTFKSETDLAEYTNTTDASYSINDANYWDEQYVGKTWWDLSNAVYYDYEQGNLAYKQGWWGTLFPTASIDIYEWTKSTVTPDQYEDAVAANTVVDNITLSGTPYTRNGPFGEALYYWTEISEYNKETETEETFYYFWVKNKITTIGGTRKYSTTQLTNILLNPSDFGYNWVAASGSSNNVNQQNSILVSNLETWINNGESVLQLNFSDVDVDLHREYILLAENDPATVIPEWLHRGLRDSIATFDRNTIEEAYVVWDAGTTYSQGTLVQSPTGDFYRANTSTIGQDPDSASAVIWSKIFDATAQPDGTYVNPNSLVVEYLAPNPVPDTNLHPLSRYGNIIRPRQSWIKHVSEARRVLVDKLNRQFTKINLVDSVPSWDRVLGSTIVSGGHTYNMPDYWEFIDWKVDGFIEGLQTDRTVNLKSELSLAPAFEGETATVRTSNDSDGLSRKQIYKYTNGVWEIQFKEKATIKLVDLLWNYNTLGYGWDNTSWDFFAWDTDPGTTLGDILDTVRFDIFVGQYTPQYADMWFTMLNYVNSEQLNLDWAFKTTYIKAVISHDLIKDTKLFVLDRIDDVIDYIDAVKPFHTKLRNLFTQRDHLENVSVTVSEQQQNMNITFNLNDLSGPDWACDEVLQGGFNWDDSTSNNDISSFTTEEGASGATIDSTQISVDTTTLSTDGSNTAFGYIINGSGFLQANCAGHGPEIYPAYFDEALDMRVTTNTAGNVENSDTRRFRMFINSNRETEAVVINTNTTLASDVSATATAIEVANGSVLDQNVANGLGVVYINNERITYSHILNNTLMNCTRGTGGTSITTHTSGDTVYEGGPVARIPTKQFIQQYGDNLRPAYNDFGKSVTDNTSTSPEAVFVNTNG